MASRARLGLSMSFTSATPDLLIRFRHKMGDTMLNTWERNNHIFWVSAFIESFAGRTLSSIRYEEVERFLHRAESQHQLRRADRDEVLNSIRMLYREIDNSEPPWREYKAPESKKAQQLSASGLSRSTIRTLLPLVEYQCQLPIALVYGSGLKLSEAARVRVGDMNLETALLSVRNEQGQVAHETVLPRVMLEPLRAHMENRRQIHMKDATHNFAGAPVAPAMAKFGEPYARSWRCQFLFADGQLSHLGDGRMIRRDINARRLDRALRMATDRVELGETVTHTNLRLSFARHLIQHSVNPIVLQYVLGQRPELPDHCQACFDDLRSPMDTLWPQGRTPWR